MKEVHGLECLKMLESGLTDYQLIRSKRKSLSIQIDHSGAIVVRAPIRLDKSVIESFINSKKKWIEKKQNLILSRKKISYEDGEMFYYLGKKYPLEIASNDKSSVDFDGEKFLLSGDGKSNLLAFYKDQFIKIVQPRIEYFSKKFHFKYRTVRYRKQKTVWGSCGPKNDINLNYLLMMSPISVIDYVLIHELCHTKIKNHSSQFWNLVEKTMPNYKEQVKWLKHHGHELHALLD